MRHAILGAGGVGGFLGVCLVRCGETVTMAVRSQTLACHPAQLQLDSPFGNWSADVAWTDVVPPADVLWVTVKATQLESALRSVRDPGSTGAVVPLLNGIDHVPLLRSKFGAARVIPATIGGELEQVAVGHIVHRTPFAVLNISAQGRALLEPLTTKLGALGLKCKFIKDETTLLWSKLVFLAPMALATSAFDRPIGAVVSDPATWGKLEACVREACAAANAAGAEVDAEKVVPFVKTFPPDMRSSMQKDVEHGRPPELDAIAGPILRTSAQFGLNAPVTEELVRRIEDLSS